MSEKKESKINTVEAQKQLDMIIDYYDIDIILIKETMEKIPIDYAIRKFKSFIEKGIIEVSDGNDGVIIKQFLGKNIGPISVLEYGPIGSKACSAVDGISTDEPERKKKVFLGKLSGKGSDVIGDLTGKDYLIADTVNTFLSIAQIG